MLIDVALMDHLGKQAKTTRTEIFGRNKLCGAVELLILLSCDIDFEIAFSVYTQVICSHC